MHHTEKKIVSENIKQSSIVILRPITTLLWNANGMIRQKKEII